MLSLQDVLIQSEDVLKMNEACVGDNVYERCGRDKEGILGGGGKNKKQLYE